MSVQGAGGTVPVSTILDYLRPEISRPDLYEERSFIVKDIHGPSSMSRRQTDGYDKSIQRGRDNTIVYTIGIIILSAAIFITLVAWTDVLRSWYDSKYVNAIIAQQTRSRIYYATTITIIAIVLILVLFFLYFAFR